MDEDLLSPEGPDVLGPAHNCFICGQPLCFRTEPNCEGCGKKCFLGCGAKAPENCRACVRTSRILLRERTKHKSDPMTVRLKLIVHGTAAVTYKEAEQLLKRSGLSAGRVCAAAGGGAAGTKAVKEAALVFASKMQEVFQNGRSVTELYVTTKKKPATSLTMASYTPMTAPAAIDAVDASLKKRGIEPMYGDAPADCLATAAELFAEAGDGVTDALVLAGLSKALEVVNELIVERVRNERTHYHGWSASRIEALEGFARSEAKKAIRRVLARSRAAVDARRAKERPKKKQARVRLAKSSAKIKKAKADGTYKRRATGDTKIHWNRKAALRDCFRRVKSAFNKVEKYGPAACTPLEIDRHAQHKAHLEACAARNAGLGFLSRGRGKK